MELGMKVTGSMTSNMVQEKKAGQTDLFIKANI